MSLTSSRERVLDQYKTADNLKARIALHERYSTNDSWYDFVFEHLLAAPQEARVLELGTGPDTLWRECAAQIPPTWDLTLTDLSDGMLAEAKETFQNLSVKPTFRSVDAQEIPFEENTFDLVIANHMLYHVPDLDKAVSEVRRVLKPGGLFCAATNGGEHMLELDELINDWLSDYGVVFERANSFNFLLENGEAVLAKRFGTVARRDLSDNTLAVDEVKPLIDYVMSMNRMRGGLESAREDLETMLEDLRKRVETKLTSGPFIIHKSSGLFVAS